MSYVSSRRHIVGSLLALVGVCACLSGIADQYWLIVVGGLYIVGYFATPKPRDAAVIAAAPHSPDAIAYFLAGLVERVRREVEPTLLTRVLNVVVSINEVLPVLARGTMQMDGTSFAVRQIATEYLPTALDAYLAISRRDRMRRRHRDERTPHEILQEQLVILDEKMRDVVVSVQRNDLQSVLDNGRFLKTRFSTPTSADAIQQYTAAR